MIFNMVTIGSGSGQIAVPLYTYTGESVMLHDGDSNWRIKFLTSGTLTVHGETPLVIDAFLVGAGGAGNKALASGGGGGKTTTGRSIILQPETPYPIVIGDGAVSKNGTQPPPGGRSSAFGLSADGGTSGAQIDGGKGGAGGSGGAPGGGSNTGGSDGSDGTGTGSGVPGKGQGTTTREFGEPDGELYAGGGGSYDSGKGGAGGGGDYEQDGLPNTGGGGGGKANGGSGIVVIRNVRTTETVASLSARVARLEENAVNRI